MGLLTDEPIVAAIVNKCGEYTHAGARAAAKAGADMICFGDDIGMQQQMMIAPDLWRKWFKPPFAKAIADVKAIHPEALVFFHSDGYIEPVIPDLIEIGVDVLNPVQPECMDPEKIKKEYGKDLSFWGTVGVQSTMPFGTPKDIRELVKRRIERRGQGRRAVSRARAHARTRGAAGKCARLRRRRPGIRRPPLTRMQADRPGIRPGNSDRTTRQ